MYVALAVFFSAFAITGVILPPYIKWSQSHEIGQYLREEGPASHFVKAKTPTAGGVCIVTAIILTFMLADSLTSFRGSEESAAVLVLAISCGSIGLIDDLAKVKRKANQGLSALLRLCLESALGATFGIAGIFLLACPRASHLLVSERLSLGLGFDWAKAAGLDPAFLLHSPTHFDISLPPSLVFLLSAFLVAATTNSVNLHDGMDGLAAGTATLVLLTMTFMLGERGLVSLALITAGSLAGFLLFNRHPAKIFMGDTGSLFVGGLLAGLVLCSGLLLWFIPLSAIYIAEALSVIFQVLYFKVTKTYKPRIPTSALGLLWLKLTKRIPGEGKRLFRMAPLHHHFEALLIDKGVDPDRAEWMVVGGFWVTQLILCAVTLAAFCAF